MVRESLTERIARQNHAKAAKVLSLSGRTVFKRVVRSSGCYGFERVRLDAVGIKNWLKALRVYGVQFDGRSKILLSFDERLPFGAENFDYILLDESTPEVADRLQRLLNKKIRKGADLT